MSSEISAQTYYNFNYTDNGGISGSWIGDPSDPSSFYDPGIPPGPSASGTLIIDNGGNIIGITNGIVTGANAGNGSIQGLIGVGTSLNNDNKFISSGSPHYLSLNGGFAFYTGSFTGDTSVPNAFLISITGYGSPAYSMASGDGSSQGMGDMTVTLTSAPAGSGAAPEMNASLIPQVALMLACLFFLFGRKKENTEPMQTA